ncbi:hypothetical protein EJ05DRAFT_447020 [Pseudovirgaria hyperparasitica]|uniref:Beta-glucuronidase C-terminal domain-containing protein n=1 Tax=Pseudovirgaria hyperparasitica TaxID=470096 RepID=A0A6A6WKE3_9PEZI|nr:uncharacterized protein EJ05DRAFT_447020 [Pseudovirgaria hyperparasitica]KAF2762651.1 hypothetical protein EJ05DRAFT_447020 [Pseudovirgaria hyperparasitica]
MKATQSPIRSLSWLLAIIVPCSALTFTVPSSPPSNASQQLDPAPIGVSLEFFAFPAYFTDVASTSPCLQNLRSLTGTWPPLRIGGTTQDRATYSASQTTAVSYTVAAPGDAPSTLTFGPSFMTLANTYGGQTIIGFNRRLNNQPNTIQAARKALDEMDNLNSIELGNEPNFYTSSDPIAGGSWSGTKDFASQVSWQTAVGSNLSTTNIFSAGVYFDTNTFSIAGLTAQESSTAAQYVREYCSHNYPQSQSSANLASLMSHSAIKSQIAPFKNEITAAKNAGKYHIMGETNSATQGGGGISPTFGAGLWLMDYSIQMLILGTKALYFHQGTVGNCQYCWWGRYSMGAPYYGAYYATMALAGADQIAPLDSGTTNYAAYAIYKAGKPVRLLLYNSDYYVSGTRSVQTFTMSGLPGTAVTAKRLTASSATARQDQGGNPTVGGQTFANGTCAIQGSAVSESAAVVSGRATFTVAASEALLVYL